MTYQAARRRRLRRDHRGGARPTTAAWRCGPTAIAASASCLGTAIRRPIPFRLRYEDDVERMQQPAAVDGDIVSPWRVSSSPTISTRWSTPTSSTTSARRRTPSCFPQGMNTAWIKPGRAVWKYLDGGENTLEEVKDFSRWAGELGFEYQVVEGFWSRWSDEEIAEPVEYSREQGVGLWFWRHSRQLRTPEARDGVLRQAAATAASSARRSTSSTTSTRRWSTSTRRCSKRRRAIRSWSTSTAPTNRPARRAPGPTS